jgi:hypothetical protein
MKTVPTFPQKIKDIIVWADVLKQNQVLVAIEFYPYCINVGILKVGAASIILSGRKLNKKGDAQTSPFYYSLRQP